MLILDSKDKDYAKPQIWNTIWSKPYKNYEKHHQFFWNQIRNRSKGKIVDLGCGSSSCYRDYPCDLVGIDFSEEACRQSSINCPFGSFIVSNLVKTPLQSNWFDTVVLCGVINYYQNLSLILKEAKRLVKKDGRIIITINVIDDFPGRHWDIERVSKEFKSLGKVLAHFEEKIGWFVVINLE